MSLQTYLEKVRAKPLAARQQLAFFWSAALTLGIILVWLLLYWLARPPADWWAEAAARLRAGWEVLRSKFQI